MIMVVSYCLFTLSLLLIFCIVLSIIYYTFKTWRFRSNMISYSEDPTYQTMRKRRKTLSTALPILFVILVFSAVIGGNEQEERDQKKILAKAEKYTGEDKVVFERKFSELKTSMTEPAAKMEAIQFTDKNRDMNIRISRLNEEEKDFFDVKFNEYKEGMDEVYAKENALSALDAEINRRNEEMQKKYDDQKKYEEWIAWQQKEAEKEKAKQAAEEEKRAQENAKREREAKRTAEKNRHKITWAKYNAIQDGMTMDDVVSIIGFRGEEQSSGFGGATYMFTGDNLAAITIVFSNGRVITKAQVGL